MRKTRCVKNAPNSSLSLKKKIHVLETDEGGDEEEDQGKTSTAAWTLRARVISYCPIHIQKNSQPVFISLSAEIIQEIVNINFK